MPNANSLCPDQPGHPSCICTYISNHCRHQTPKSKNLDQTASEYLCEPQHNIVFFLVLSTLNESSNMIMSFCVARYKNLGNSMCLVSSWSQNPSLFIASSHLQPFCEKIRLLGLYTCICIWVVWSVPLQFAYRRITEIMLNISMINKGPNG